jgi:hypothetical protein
MSHSSIFLGCWFAKTWIKKRFNDFVRFQLLEWKKIVKITKFLYLIFTINHKFRKVIKHMYFIFFCINKFG